MIVEVMPLMRPLVGLNTGRRYDVRPFLRLGTLEFSEVLRRADFLFRVKLGTRAGTGVATENSYR
jgi:hypothetical protein